MTFLLGFLAGIAMGYGLTALLSRQPEAALAAGAAPVSSPS
jgi:hypothetical protein